MVWCVAMHPKTRRRLGRITALALVSLFGATGCLGLDPDGATVAAGDGCRLAGDQEASYLHKIRATLPVSVTIDSRFTPAHRAEVERAVSVWNASSNRLLGRDFFRPTVAGISAAGVPGGRDDCSFAGASDRFVIVREDSAARWNELGLGSGNPGVTVSCTVGDGPVRQLTRQVIMIHTSYARREQFMSVALHELGHAGGLDHSCVSEAGRKDYADCGGLADAHPYRVAAMFPSLMVGPAGSGGYEMKEDLRQNDLDRTQCLYR